jgi:hypothetical protein
MPAVNGVGEPCAGEPHARFDVAGAGAVTTRPRARESAQPTGKSAEYRPPALPSVIITDPVPDPTRSSAVCRSPHNRYANRDSAASRPDTYAWNDSSASTTPP